MSAGTLLAAQLVAARALFDEAVRTGALARGAVTVLGAALGHAFLGAWARAFRIALPNEGHPVLVYLAWALQDELEGKLAAAVADLGEGLVEQGHMPDSDFLADVGRIGPTPTVEELRTVLQTWINRCAARGGPIVAWMRDLSTRLGGT